MFRSAIDRCADYLRPGLDLRRVLHAAGDEALLDTGVAQPALFAVGYATAALWQSWGVRPAVMLGHSVGEFVAACLAGVMSLEDALGLLVARGRLMAAMPPGAMLAVRMAEAELAPLLGGAIDLAAVNGPSLCVASGAVADIAGLEAVLGTRGVMCRRLQVRHAFHSRMMDGVVGAMGEAAAGIGLNAPSVPFASCVTGALISAEQAVSAAYWALHCRAPVRFAAGLDCVLASGPRALLECGPGRTLTMLALQSGALQGGARGSQAAVVASLGGAGARGDDQAAMAEAIARLGVAGVELDWLGLHGAGRRRVALPATPWERVRCWIDEAETVRPVEVASGAVCPVASGADGVLAGLVTLLEDLSGDRFGGVDAEASFLQLGFDSLFLGQVAQQVRSRFGVEVTFRQLMGELGSLGRLAAHVGAGRPAPAVAARLRAGMTPGQLAHVAGLVAATVARTGASKRMTAEARRHLADPRAAAGFRVEWKEMIYPVVAVRSAGPFIWDADGNKYVDLVNGFGQTAFGHAPGFVTEAVRRQLERGFEIGPQAELAGRVAARFCAMTGHERMTFCNTGSEAVMAAIRVARAVTGRSRVVVFTGSYHGQFDEVLVKATPKGARAVAPGIPLESVQNVTVLEYGADASVAWIGAHAGDLAAVIAEPVQSRHPALQPRAFLQAIREITARSGTCLAFDEVVTGFRTGAGGMQALFGIRADLATYGKVVGGGMPVGILAGRSAFMDALDGGDWDYGDESSPDAAVTFFAGTFVRHPLALAAVEAVLTHIEAGGPALYSGLAARTAGLVARMNAALAGRGLAPCVESFASWFCCKLPDGLATLLYPNMRLRGVHIQEGFPCFLTTTHGVAEIDRIADAFAASLDALQSAGILLPEGALAGAQAGAKAGAQAGAPLTEAQMEVWLAAQMGDAASCAFNEGVCLHLRGTLDVAGVRGRLNAVFGRHDALRARFTATGSRMVIGGFRPLVVEVERRPLDEVLEEEARTPFDLVAGPPVRVRLVRVRADHHVLVLMAHHIVCDGWSINTLLAELAGPHTLPPALSFAAYAASRHGARADADLAWWKACFASLPAPLDLPGDRARPAVRSYRGGTRHGEIGPALLARVKAAGARSGCTLLTTLLATVGVLVGRLAGRTDVVIAVPAAAQAQLAGEALVGHCANLLPLRARWGEDMRFADYLAEMGQVVLDGYEHQDCTLGTIVRALQVPRDTSRLVLTEVQFNLERLADGLTMPGLTVSCAAAAKAFVNFDLFFNAVESAAGLAIDCDYNADLFDAGTVDRWLGHLRVLLEAVAADTSQEVGRLALLSGPEQAALLGSGNCGAMPVAPVHHLIAAQAARRPDAIAARFGESRLSYGALEARANQMAHHLLAVARPGDRIGVMLERTPEMLATLLGAWKAGLAYVPLDPSHPPARLRHIIADARVAAVVTDGDGADWGARVIDIRADRAAIGSRETTAPRLGGPGLGGPGLGGPGLGVTPDAVAYVIYTSGSTGTPKGVAVGHAALGNLLLSFGREPGIAPGDVWLAVTTIAFDIAGLELWGPLLAGAQVVVASRADAVDGHRLRALLSGTGATIMQATPATWRLLLEAGWEAGGLTMLCGGEALPRSLADRLLEGGGALWNVYGPTETTIWSALDRVGSGPITVGHPIANTTLRILDAAGRLAPAGVPGELHIGGAGLAHGYFDQPALTAERFVADPFGPGRLYKTGDLARRLADGRVQVVGRIDSQMKLRGFRLEAGEVEHVLTGECGLLEAAVALREGIGGEKRLVAWAVPRPGEALDEGMLRGILRAHLPEYMVPSQFVAVARLKLAPNGKVDRAALPEAPVAAVAVFEPARTALERRLAEIWSGVLARPVGRLDDLLVLGADSIQLFQITARANAADIALLTRHLLQHRTVAGVAAALDGLRCETPAIPALKQFFRSRPETVAD